MKRYAHIVLLMLTVALSACGWHLRGAPILMDLGSISISGGSFDIKDLLIDRLEESEIDVVNKHADYQLKLSDEHLDKRTVAVDEKGRAAETELNYHIRWILYDKDGNAVTDGGRVNLIRSVNYDPTNTAASSDEEDAAKETMYEDAALQLMNQLNAATKHLMVEPDEADIKPETRDNNINIEDLESEKTK